MKIITEQQRTDSGLQKDISNDKMILTEVNALHKPGSGEKLELGNTQCHCEPAIGKEYLGEVTAVYSVGYIVKLIPSGKIGFLPVSATPNAKDAQKEIAIGDRLRVITVEIDEKQRWDLLRVFETADQCCKK